MSKFLQTAQQLVNNLKSQINEVPSSLPFDYGKMLDENRLPTFLKIGNLLGAGDNNYPALLALDKIKGIAFRLNDTNREEAHLAIQFYILQIVERSRRDYVSVAVIDTKKMGSNFRNLRKLGKNILTHFVVDEENVKTILDEQHSKSVSIITECLSNHQSLADYNEKTGHVQPFRILAIADFPHGFSNFDKLETLLQNADEAGLFVFLTYDAAQLSYHSKTNQDKFYQVLSHLCCMEEYGNPENDFYNLEFSKPPTHNTQPIKNYTLQLDRKDISFDNVNKLIDKLIPEAVAENVSTDGIRIPIGKVAGQVHCLTFGYDTDNYSAIIGGQAGKGKSNLLNNIVARGMDIYTSDELRFAIIDCSGVGFHEFKNAPNIELMCQSSDVETCITAVQYIEKEFARREMLFKETGVADLIKYVAKTGKPLPRLICLIDEFHVLYTAKEKYSAYFDTILLDKVIRIGRKFGVHLIACTQSLGGGVRRSILDNIPLRIALGMTADQSNGFLGLKNDAAANLERGIAIYNPQNGNLSANKVVKIDLMEETDIERIITSARLKNQNSEKINVVNI